MDVEATFVAAAKAGKLVWLTEPGGRYRVVDERFAPRDDYNPFNEAIFPEVIFALPTRDGRVREPNAE